MDENDSSAQTPDRGDTRKESAPGEKVPSPLTTAKKREREREKSDFVNKPRLTKEVGTRLTAAREATVTCLS